MVPAGTVPQVLKGRYDALVAVSDAAIMTFSGVERAEETAALLSAIAKGWRKRGTTRSRDTAGGRRSKRQAQGQPWCPPRGAAGCLSGEVELRPDESGRINEVRGED